MKHLLILISFLLLSSPLFCHPTGEHTLYRWEISSGYVWKGFGDKDTHPVYKGDGRMGNHMVKVQKLYLMEESMKENGRMGNEMVKEHGLQLTE